MYGYPSFQTAMFLNENTLEQIQFYLCKWCLWINCRITATSWRLHKYCGIVHHLFFHHFESNASVTISSMQQAPYSYHITILMEHIRKTLVGFEVFLQGKREKQIPNWTFDMQACRLRICHWIHTAIDHFVFREAAHRSVDIRGLQQNMKLTFRPHLLTCLSTAL